VAQDDAVDLGFIAPPPPEQTSIFDQLLRGTADDPEASEPSDTELGSLEEEFRRLDALDMLKQRLADQLDEVTKRLAAQRERMLAAMDGQGTQQFRGLEGGGACFVRTEYTTDVRDPEAFMGWVKETHPELLTVNSQTRTSFIRRQYRDQGVPEDDPSFPPGIEVAVRRTLALRRPKRAEGEKTA